MNVIRYEKFSQYNTRLNIFSLSGSIRYNIFLSNVEDIQRRITCCYRPTPAHGRGGQEWAILFPSLGLHILRNTNVEIFVPGAGLPSQLTHMKAVSRSMTLQMCARAADSHESGQPQHMTLQTCARAADSHDAAASSLQAFPRQRTLY